MKKIIITILLLSLTGCTSSNLGGQAIKKSNKLRVTKEKILKSKKINKCVEYKNTIINNFEKGATTSTKVKSECKKQREIIKYHYISNKKVPAKKMNFEGTELTEDIKMRTGNAFYFKITDNDKTSLLEKYFINNVFAKEEEKYVGIFYPVSQLVSVDGDWYEVAEATTTVENYNEQTATTTSISIINFFRKIAKADTSTFYTEAGDGYVGYGWSTWDEAHDSAVGNNGISHTVTSMNVFSGYNTNSRGFKIYRAFTPFNLSSLSGTITSATLKMTVFTKNDYDNDQYAYISILEGNQASVSSLVLADYEKCGSTSTPIEMIDSDDRADITDYAVDDVVSFPLNSTGIALVESSKGGYLKLCAREGHDIEDVPVTNSGYSYSSLYFNTSESSGTSEDPYLEVVFTPTTVGTSVTPPLISF